MTRTPPHLQIVEAYGQETRYLAIARTYYEALDGRPLETVDLAEVTKAIRAWMPDATPEEIGEGLAWNEQRKAYYEAREAGRVSVREH